MPVYALLNGKLTREEKICISPNNRSFRYGEGFFETMKVHKGRLLLASLHLQRIDQSLAAFESTLPKHQHLHSLEQQVTELAAKNGHPHLCRVRVTFFRGDGGLHDAFNPVMNYLVQTWALEPSVKNLNEHGLVAGVYHQAQKTCDALSNLKSNNFLPYAMAAAWAKKHQLNDCILLNSRGTIADATIANVFVVKNNRILTPPLCDGPVAGVMRRYILQQAAGQGITVQEQSLTVNHLLEAEEMFFTNAIYGVKWVEKFGEKLFTNSVAARVHSLLVAPLYI